MIRPVFEKIVQDPKVEATWLHTVSMLEFIGARKISRTVAARHPDAQVLEHLADETRHAHAFKVLALSLNEGREPGYLCPKEAATYFGTLDEEASKLVAALFEQADQEERMKRCYLLVTALIERRAMRVHPLHKSCTTHEHVKEELHQVILEEANHRAMLEREAKLMLSPFAGAWEKAVALEETALKGLVTALCQTLDVTVKA